MTTNSSNALERLFPRRDLLRGPARWVFVWSALGSVVLVLLLADFFLIADLLDNRGRLPDPSDHAQAARAILGEKTSAEPPAEAEGILPAVWWSRDKYWGSALAVLYRRVPPLRDNMNALMALLLAALVLGVVRSLLLWQARAAATGAALDVVTRTRRSLHRQALRLGPSDLQETGSDHVSRLFTQDAQRVREGITLVVRRLNRYPLELGLLAVLAVSTHWLVALQCLFPLAASWYVFHRRKQRSEAERRLSADRSRDELRVLAESLYKTRIVCGYGMEDFEHEQFQKHLQRFRDDVWAMERSESWSRWASWVLVMICATIILFLIGMKVVFHPQELPLGAALLLLGTFVCMYRPLESLWRLPGDRAEASAAADRIHRYLQQIPAVGQAVGAKFLEPLSRNVQFEAVNFALPGGRTLLDRFDLKLDAGEVVGLVSANPLEARAVAYMLPRFIEPQSGRILIDGEDIAWVTLESLRAETLYVGGADPFLTGTVRENIGGGDERYSLQEITDAAKETHAHNFIIRLPQGYETVLGEHGEQLGPGEAFRLGLARAVLRDPAVMIVEEPGTTLDPDEKSLLDDAYNRIMRGRTVLFLPSRLSTLKRADRLVLIHRGRVEAVAPHSELVRSSELYRHWEYIHFNEFRHEMEMAP